MIDMSKIVKEFRKGGKVLKTAELNKLGLSSRQIKKLLEEKDLRKLKQGFYEMSDEVAQEEIIIAKLFPDAVIFLESALLHYGYTDRIPTARQIAVDRDSEKSRYEIDQLLVKPFYQEPKFLKIGVSTYKVNEVDIKIFDRNLTICDVLRYENKLEKEVYSNAVMRFIKDPKKNIRYLFTYADVFNITKKTQSQVGKLLY